MSQTKSIAKSMLLILGLGIGSLSLVAIVGASFLSSHIHFLVDLAKVQEDNAEMTGHLGTSIQEWKNTLLRGADSEARVKYWNSFLAENKTLDQRIDTAQKDLSADSLKEELALLDQFSRQLKAARLRYEEGYQAYQAANFDAAVGDAEVKGVDRELKDSLQRYIDAITEQIEQERASASTTSTVIISVIIIGSLGILFGMYVSINRIVVSRSELISKQMVTLASGDLRQKIEVPGEDEIANVAKNAEAFRKFINDLSKDIQEVSRELQTSSSAVNQGSQQISLATSAEEHQVHQAATALTEMSATVQEIARHANSTAQQTDEVTGATSKALDQMIRSANISQQLAGEMASAAKIVAQLRDETKNIGQVLDVIKGIAEQTNLLALNAAIEAARAGEQGRGFAVVADEVRNLAQRTQESTSEIQQIIQNVQNGATNAANAMEQGNRRSEESASQSESARQGLAAIADSISGIRDMNTQIATAAEEQNSVVEEITRNVNSISESSKSNAAAARSGANTSGNLNSLAVRLSEMISTLKT